MQRSIDRRTAEEAVDDLLVAESLAGTDHVHRQRDRGGQRELAPPDEMVVAKGGIKLGLIGREESMNEGGDGPLRNLVQS